MQPEELAQRLRQLPFQPFRIHVAGGAVYEIRQPRLVWVFRSRVEIFFPDKRLPLPAVDGSQSVPLESIIGVEPLEAPAQPSSP